MYYVVVDIGCIECDEDTSVLGIFTDYQKAHEVAHEHSERQGKNWHGEHSFEIFDISKINKEYKVDY